MGTWGVGGFESDAALDWAAEFEDADLETGLKLIRDTLNFDGAGTEGMPDLAESLAVAAAEMVIVINGHPAPEPPDTHHLAEMMQHADDAEDAEPLSDEELAAETEAEAMSLGMALAEGLGRPGEIFVFEETEVFYQRPGEEQTTVMRWERGVRQPDETEDEDDEEEWTNDALDWIGRTHPASDPDLTELARQAITRVTGPGSHHSAAEWCEEEDAALWRSYLAELAAKLAE